MAILCGLDMLKLLQGTKSAAWAKFVKLYPKLALFPEPSIEFNKRLSSTAGRCFYELNKIDISWKLFEIDQREILEQTVPHELAHQVAWNLFKAPGHCANWKSIMVIYGLEPNRCHNIGMQEIPDNTFELMARRDQFKPGTRVSFEHRDRSRKVSIIEGYIEKVNLKTFKVSTNSGVWTVPVESSSLKVI